MYSVLTVTCTLFEPDHMVKPQSRVYSELWVEKLYRAVQRNLSIEHRFICYTDRWRVFDEPIQQHILPDGFTGMQKNLVPLTRIGRCLKLDLDNVIVGYIDQIALMDAKLAMPRDPNFHDKAISSPILTTEPVNLSGYQKFRSEQDFLRTLPCTFIDDVLPGQVASYKKHVRGKGVGDARIIHFHGDPKPTDVEEGFVAEHWT